MTQLFDRGAPDALYLIDISGYVFRAYHAIAPLESPTGEPTHAILGTVTMLERLIKQRDPARIIVAMDAGKQTFRTEMYPEYKAQRPPAPEDLISQMRRVQEVLKALNIPVLRQPGVEADDLIATAVKHACEQGLRVVVVSADKDLLQLVSEDVLLWDTMRNRVSGPEEVITRFGVRADQMRDLLALMGDSSDNIPGVPSVGPKTAQKLLESYGSMEGVYEHLDEIKRNKLREALIEHKALALMSQKLVTLKDDCPIEFNLEAMSRPQSNLEALRSLYSELGFQRQLLALADAPTDSSQDASPQEAAPALDVRPLTDPEQLTRLLSEVRASKRLTVIPALQASTDGSHLIGLAFSSSPTSAFYAPLGHRYVGSPPAMDGSQLSDTLKQLLADGEVCWAGHDTKLARLALAQIVDVPVPFDFDTQLASYLLTPEARHSLTDLSESVLASPLPQLESLTHPKRGTHIALDQLPVEDLGQLLGKHATCVAAVWSPLQEKLKAEHLSELFETLEMPLSRLLTQLETRGVLVDGKMLQELSARLEVRLTELNLQAHEMAGRTFNVNSPRQLETLLFDELNLKPLKRTKTARSTDATTLEALTAHHPLPAVILEIRQLVKLKGTYLDALPSLINSKTGRIHTRWGQVTAATGRLASSDPNLQNIPIRTELGRSIRGAFRAPTGYQLVSADYSQIELRVLAHLSQDPVLLESFQNNEDVHTRTAREIFQVAGEEVTAELRRRAKAVNFGVVYGQGELGLAKSLGIAKSDAAKFIADYFERYAGVRRFMEEVLEKAREDRVVHTLLGRVRQVPDIRSSHPGRRAAAERVVMNTPIQGTAADLLKLAMLSMQPPPTPGCRMTLTVHDELVFEVPTPELETAKTEIKRRMESVYALDVPLLVDVGHGPAWDSAH